MEAETIKIVGQVAGVGGLALGVFFLLLRRVGLPKATRHQLTLFMILAWSIAVLGLVCWTYIEVSNSLSRTESRDGLLLATIIEKLTVLERGFKPLQDRLIDHRQLGVPQPSSRLSDSLIQESNRLQTTVVETRQFIQRYRSESGPLPEEVEKRTTILDRAETITSNPLGFIWEEVEIDPISHGRTDQAGCLAKLVAHTGRVLAIAFSPDRSLLATGSEDKTIRIWNTANWSLRSTLRGYESAVQAIAFSNDSRRIAWGGDGAAELHVKFWDIRNSKEEPTRSIRVVSWPSRVYSLAFTPDDKWLAAGSSGPVKVWSLTDAADQRTLEWQVTYPSYCYSIAFSTDGATLAAGLHGGSLSPSTNESVRLWDWRKGVQRDEFIGGNGRSLSLSHSDVRSMVAFSPDGLILVRLTKGSRRLNPMEFGRGFGFESNSGNLTLWNLGKGNAKESYEVPGGNAFALTVLSDGNVIVAAVNGAESNRGLAIDDSEGRDASMLRLWTLHRQQELLVSTGHTGNVLAVALSPDGTRVATAGSEDNAVIIWDLKQLLNQR